MSWRDWWLRVRALAAPRKVERELDEELGFHLEMETRKQLAAGLSPANARAQARVRFGPASIADECRDARGIAFIDSCLRDIRYALRTFRRTPTVTATVIGTIALGLGLCAAVFTIFNALVFALGATAGTVTRLVLWQSLRLVTLGLAAGACLAWGVSTILTSMLPVAGPFAGTIDLFDGVAYGGSLLSVLAACVLAASVPALRAARIDPIATLRHD
jgi:predicted lysophospholipase L1 biosynthesis ABC-type transport system permease subunit